MQVLMVVPVMEGGCNMHFFALLLVISLMSFGNAHAQEAVANTLGVASSQRSINVTVEELIQNVTADIADLSAIVAQAQSDIDGVEGVAEGLRDDLDAIAACTEGIAGFDANGNVTCAVAPFCDSGTLMLNGNTSECRTAEEPIKNVTPGGCRGGFVRQSGVDTAGNTFSRCVFDASGIGR